MKKYYFLFSIMAVLLVGSKAHTTDLHTPALEPESILSKLQRSSHLDDIEFDNPPVRDSVSLDSFIVATCSIQHIPGVATWASKNGHVDVVEFLLADPRVDPFNNDNYAIVYASKNGHFKIVKLLLADPRVRDELTLNEIKKYSNLLKINL